MQVHDEELHELQLDVTVDGLRSRKFEVTDPI